MVTISLFDSLLGLHNEQIMVELILKHLNGAPHIPNAQKYKINKIQAYAQTVDYLLELAPEVMKNSKKILAKHKCSDFQQPSSLTVHKNPEMAVSITIGTNWNHYGLHVNGESLYSNYHAYLFDAHEKIKQKKQACDGWSNNYFFKNLLKSEQLYSKCQIPNDQLVLKIQNFLSEFNGSESSDLKYDSLRSIGECSGYESMKFRPDDYYDDQVNGGEIHQNHHPLTTSKNTPNINQNSAINQFSGTINSHVTNVEPWRISRCKDEQVIELDDNFLQGTVTLGNFINL